MDTVGRYVFEMAILDVSCIFGHAVHDIFICCLGVMLCMFGFIFAIVVAILDHIGMKKMGLADTIKQQSNNMVGVISIIVAKHHDVW